MRTLDNGAGRCLTAAEMTAPSPSAPPPRFRLKPAISKGTLGVLRFGWRRLGWARVATQDHHFARASLAAQLPTGAVGAEIGVFKGEFSEILLSIARPKKLYLIDPWENSDDPDVARSMYAESGQTDMNATHQSVLQRFSGQIATAQVEVCRGTSEEVLSTFAPDTLDFVYIDGDHRYGGVMRDLELAFDVVKRGGVIALDDHRRGGWWSDGVIRAANEFAGRHPREVQVIFAMHHQLAFRKLRPFATDPTDDQA